jgi:hypothetical protein
MAMTVLAALAYYPPIVATSEFGRRAKASREALFVKASRNSRLVVVFEL